MLTDRLIDHGVGRGDPVAIAASDRGWAVVTRRLAVHGDSFDELTHAESAIGPRWVWWDRATADALVRAGVDIGRCWDVLAVHRLQRGGWFGTVDEVWNDRHGLDPERGPRLGQLDLLGAGGGEGDDPEQPRRPDGYLRPEWVADGWAATPERLTEWARLAGGVAAEQRTELYERGDANIVRAAHVESVTELLCAELAAHGLPFDTETATTIIGAAAGPRPRDDTHDAELRDARDAAVLEHVPPGRPVDLRSPADVKAMLRRIELDLPDTRAWRLQQHVDHHPLVPALLRWRKAERLTNTYGYRWLDTHVRDGRLRGVWSAADGAAGRMTASAGLHNLPAELRPAVRADPGHVFIRADLGQIEPRVLAAVSGDDVLIAATADDDLYQPVADRLRVTRDVAKVAVLGAMYGGTSGEQAHALRGLQREYPVAMALLSEAASAGERGELVRTYGGRPVHMWVDESVAGNIERARRVAAARGRYARNAIIQGAAAELFKMWAITVRARGRALGAQVVLCLHDELLVHVPDDVAADAAAIVADALGEAAHRWSPQPDVRFVADISAIERWSDAKP